MESYRFELVNGAKGFYTIDDGRVLDRLLLGIRANIAIKNYKKVSFYFVRLERLTKLKVTIPIETRVILLKILVNLISEHNMPTQLVSNFAILASHLLNKIHFDTAFTADWRLLYDTIRRLIYPKQRNQILPSTLQASANLSTFILTAKNFFPQTTSIEVLDEFLPQINFNNISSSYIYQSFLLFFLPTNQIPTQINFKVDSPHFFWVPTIFNLWSLQGNSEMQDCNILDVVARLAHDQVASPHLVGWTESQVKRVFIVGLKLMHVPVGSVNGTQTSANPSSGGITNLSKGKVENLAIFIVYTIYPVQPSEDTTTPRLNTMKHLADLICALENYYHPSNRGSWSKNLSLFMENLSSEFLKRLVYEKKENEKNCKIPANLRLTDEIKTEFVLLLKRVAFLAMFGKDPISVVSAQLTLKNLAWIDPDLIFPELLEICYGALETLTDTHRTMSCIGTLCYVAPSLISRSNYPQGARNIPQILNLVLPGIDINDPNKSYATFSLLCIISMFVPMFDLSSTFSSNKIKRKFDLSGRLKGEKGLDLIDLADEDDAVKLGTAYFEEWIVDYVDRVFKMFENLPVEHGTTSSRSTEKVLLVMSMYASHNLFMQLSPELLKLVTNKIKKFVSETVISNATKAVGQFVSKLHGSNSEYALKTFIPLCVEKMIYELENGVCQLPTSPPTVSSKTTRNPYGFASMSDATFHWYQCILFNITTNCDGTMLLDVELKRLVQLALKESIEHCQSWRGYKWAAKLLKEVIKSLGTIYPLESGCFDPVLMSNNKEFRSSSHFNWGSPPPTDQPNTLKINWHIPNDAEIEFLFALIKEYAELSMNKLASLMSTSMEMTPDPRTVGHSFCKWLTILQSVICSINYVCGEERDENSDIGDMEDDLSSFYPINCGLPFAGSKDERSIACQSLRNDIGRLLVKIGIFLKDNRATDVDSIQVFGKCMIKFTVEYGGGLKTEFVSSMEKGYRHLKSRTRLSRKGHDPMVLNSSYDSAPRFILIKRAYVQHVMRVSFNMTQQVGFTVETRKITNELFNLMVDFSINNSFAEVRKSSQRIIQKIISMHTFLRDAVFPQIVNILEVPKTVENVVGENADRMKGALYLLLKRSFVLFGLQKWENIQALLKVSLRVQHEDKPSVQKLARKFFVEYLKHFSQIENDFSQNDILISLGEELCSGLIGDSKTYSDAASWELEKANSKSSYKELIDVLTSFIKTPNVHWYYLMVAHNFLGFVLRDDTPISVDIMEVVLDGVLSDIRDVRYISQTTLLKVCLSIQTRSSKGGHSLVSGCKEEIPFDKIIRNHDDIKNYTAKFERMVNEDSITEDNFKKTVFVDNMNLGYYCFPKKARVYYAGPDLNNELPFPEPESNDAIQYLRNKMTSSTFWDAFLPLVSLEGERDVEHISHDLIKMYKSLFIFFQDEFIELVRPTIIKMSESITEKNLQRSAAEFVIGIITGSKYWGWEKLEKLWGWMLPLFEKIITNATPEVIVYWETALKMICKKRDLRRLQPLVKLIITNSKLDPTSHSFFTEAKKLSLLRILITSSGWRFSDVCSKISLGLLESINHPYEQVRLNIGATLNSCFQYFWHPSALNVVEILKWNLQNRSGGWAVDNIISGDCLGDVPLILDEEKKNALDRVVVKFEEWRVLGKDQKGGSTDYANAGKTVLAWFQTAISNFVAAGLYPFIKYLLPMLPQFQDFDDVDLNQYALRVSQYYPHFPHSAPLLKNIIKQLNGLLLDKCASWHSKVQILPILQVLFFLNLHYLDEEIEVLVMTCLSGLLKDSQIEVRQTASVTLSGIIRCSQRDSVKKILDKFMNELHSLGSIPKRSHRTGNGVDEAENIAIVKQKHSIVLGLNSLILAFPYEVPVWMPEVLETLALSISDPSPISVTIKNLFSEFKRTHQDTWHTDSLLFTADQLVVLNDLLISPSYYV